MKKAFKIHPSLFIMSLSLTSCGELAGALVGTESETAYINSTLSLFTQSLHLRDNAEPYLSSRQSQSRYLKNLLFPQIIRPLAGACTQGTGITASSCASGGIQSYTYNDCEGNLTSAVYTGTLNFDFSTSSCNFDGLVPGDSISVTTTNFSTTSTDSSVVSWSSSSHTNYLGDSYSGGYQLLNDSGQLKLTPVGIRRQKSTAAGSAIYDHTIRPYESFPDVTIDISPRTVTGYITIDSNSAEFTASLNLASVAWGSASCGHPTSGTINISYGGSKSGTAEFSFTGTCGAIENTGTGEVFTLDSPF